MTQKTGTITIQKLRKASGMRKTQFAEYFGIPYRTIQNWELDINKCPQYLIELMAYKLQNEGRLKAEK